MRATVVHTVSSTLPPNDVHPYRTGAWTPNHREWDATDLDVVEGAIPDDLAGVYLRNTENPVHDSIGLYHPFDGDGMVHQIAFANGAATYCNRFVQTDGLRAEQDAAQALWTGLFDRPENSKRCWPKAPMCRSSFRIHRHDSPWCRGGGRRPTSVGSKQTQPTCCIGSTLTKRVMRSCSTASFNIRPPPANMPVTRR